jgi:hypothetical protein
VPYESKLPAFVDMRLLDGFKLIAILKSYIEIIDIAFYDVHDPVLTGFSPVKKSKKIHIFTPYNLKL